MVLVGRVVVVLGLVLVVVLGLVDVVLGRVVFVLDLVVVVLLGRESVAFILVLLLGSVFTSEFARVAVLLLDVVLLFVRLLLVRLRLLLVTPVKLELEYIEPRRPVL